MVRMTGFSWKPAVAVAIRPVMMAILMQWSADGPSARCRAPNSRASRPRSGPLQRNTKSSFLFRQQFADGLQFLPARLAGFGITHFELLQRIEHNVRDDEPRVFLVVGGHDKPRRAVCAC